MTIKRCCRQRLSVLSASKVESLSPPPAKPSIGVKNVSSQVIVQSPSAPVEAKITDRNRRCGRRRTENGNHRITNQRWTRAAQDSRGAHTGGDVKRNIMLHSGCTQNIGNIPVHAKVQLVAYDGTRT
jgi:hypothetical protein